MEIEQSTTTKTTTEDNEQPLTNLTNLNDPEKINKISEEEEEMLEEEEEGSYNNINNNNTSVDDSIFDNFNPIGIAFFSNDIFRKINHKFLTDFICDYLKNLNWDLEFEFRISEKEAERLHALMGIMKEAHLSGLSLTQRFLSLSESALYHIVPINFPYLERLSLYKCEIMNIEPLVYLRAPALKKLNLIYNHITNYKTLSKGDFPNLEYLMIISEGNHQNQHHEQQEHQDIPIVLRDMAINNNPFEIQKKISLTNISRWRMPKLKELRLEKYRKNDIIEEDLSILTKIESKQLELLYVIPNRIVQTEAIWCLKNKCTSENYEFGIMNYIHEHGSYLRTEPLPGKTRDPMNYVRMNYDEVEEKIEEIVEENKLIMEE